MSKYPMHASVAGDARRDGGILSALYASVYEAPGDVARRRVLADALTERGEPRGEFITLQLETSARARKRAAKLLERHRDEFLGALRAAVVPGTDEWSGGFLRAAHVQLSGQLSWARSWATVERLAVQLRAVQPSELWEAPFHSLRQVQLVPVRDGDWHHEPMAAWHERQAWLSELRARLAIAGRAHVLPRGREWLLT